MCYLSILFRFWQLYCKETQKMKLKHALNPTSGIMLKPFSSQLTWQPLFSVFKFRYFLNLLLQRDEEKMPSDFDNQVIISILNIDCRNLQVLSEKIFLNFSCQHNFFYVCEKEKYWHLKIYSLILLLSSPFIKSPLS